MRTLAVESLIVRNFRNLSSVDLELGGRFNVLSGDNGQGKTNLLEAVYVLATSRSFRTGKLVDLVRAGDETASVRARVREGNQVREQSVGVRSGLRAVRIDGKRPPTLGAYAVGTPVVVFHPGAVALSAGSGAERRKLLDRLALYLDPAAMAEATSYARAARARQRILELRGEGAVDLSGWEELMVRHGLCVSDARESVAARLGSAAAEAFAGIGPGNLSLETRYHRSAPKDAETFRRMLGNSRSKDRARGSASFGPHRDDLVLDLGGRPARGVASQGQHRIIVLALELAEIRIISEARDLHPILLLDDVSSELDRARASALFTTLCRAQGQVLLTTTRPDLVDTTKSSAREQRRDFSVVGGRIAPA
jgi:DNA replication and repair protein RecF